MWSSAVWVPVVLRDQERRSDLIRVYDILIYITVPSRKKAGKSFRVYFVPESRAQFSVEGKTPSISTFLGQISSFMNGDVTLTYWGC